MIVLLACVLGLASADTATVGAAATPLINALHITNTDIGLLVSVTAIVAAVASLPFGVLADRARRTRVLAVSVVLWGLVMLWSASVATFGGLLFTRLVLGLVTAGAGPLVASLVGDYFPSAERGRIYGYVLTGELLGAGLGFEVTGDVAAISWRAAFVIVAIPALLLGRFLWRLPEPVRGGAGALDRVAPPPRRGPPGSSSSLPVPAGFPLTDIASGQPPRAFDQDAPDLGAASSAPADVAAPPSAGDASSGGASTGQETDAQRLARERGLAPDPELVLRRDPRRMGVIAATRYVLRIRTNVVLIVAGACGYYFLAGVQTFGFEFVRDRYHVSQAVAGLLMLVVGAGAVGGVLVAGRLGDLLLQRGMLSARVLVSAVAAALTVVAFIPALLTRSPLTAVPYVIVAAFALGAQNPPIDAARLDIVPPLLWGRAEGVRSMLRTAAQAVAPVLFGAVSEYIFGVGDAQKTGSSLRWTFVVMLVPLAANAVILFRAMRSYPRDVATAAASAQASASAAANAGTGTRARWRAARR